jgi:hypothetical protein
MDLLVPLALMDNLVLLELLLALDHLAQLDLLDHPALLEIQVLLVNPETKEMMEPVELAPQDLKGLLAHPELLALPGQLETLELMDKQVLLDPLDLPEIQDNPDLMDNLAHLVALDFPAPMPHIVPAHLVQLSSSAAALKLAKSAHFDHDIFFPFETIQVVFALCIFYLCTPK